MQELGINFLKRTFSLKKDPNVAKSLKRYSTKLKNKEKVKKKHSVNEKIEIYLDRIKEIFENKEKSSKKQAEKYKKIQEKVKNTLTQIIFSDNIVKTGNVPNSYFEENRNMIEELGYGRMEINSYVKNEIIKILQKEQKESLGVWINYLSSGDARYPSWFKYWVFRSVLSMGAFSRKQNKGDSGYKTSYERRNKSTIAPFPELNSEVLSYIFEALSASLEKQDIQVPNNNNLSKEKLEEINKEFHKLINSGKFSKIYPFVSEKIFIDYSALHENTKGEWREFETPHELVDTLRGYSTGWCIAGSSVASSYLKSGKLIIYYSQDNFGESKIPRIAIHKLHNGEIREVRGTAPGQELDGYIAPVLEKKLGEFGREGDRYMKWAKDMSLLSKIEQKTNTYTALDKNELTFLYEIDRSIRTNDSYYFGVGGLRSNAKAIKLIKKRNVLKDLSIIFNSQDTNFIISKLLFLKKHELLEENITKIQGVNLENFYAILTDIGPYHIVNNLDSFEEIDYIKLINVIMKSEKPKEYLAALFSEKNDAKILDSSLYKFLIKESEFTQKLISILKKQKIKFPKIINFIIEADKIIEISENIHKIDNREKSVKELSNILIEKEKKDVANTGDYEPKTLIGFMEKNHEKIKNIGKSIIDFLIEHKKSSLLFKFIDKIDEKDLSYMLDTMIQENETSKIFHNWSVINKKINNSKEKNYKDKIIRGIISELIKNKYAGEILKNFKKFEAFGVNPILNLIIKSKQSKAIIPYLNNLLKNLEPSHIAKSLINEKQLETIFLDYKYFESIFNGENLEEYIQLIIEKKQEETLFKNFKVANFNNQTQILIANIFIKKRKIGTLVNNLAVFKDKLFDKKICEIFVKNGYIDNVAKNLIKFYEVGNTNIIFRIFLLLDKNDIKKDRIDKIIEAHLHGEDENQKEGESNMYYFFHLLGNIDHNALIQRALRSKNKDLLKQDGFINFKGLDYDSFNALIINGFGDGTGSSTFIVKNISCFNDLPLKAAKWLIKYKKVSKDFIESNIEVFIQRDREQIKGL